MSKTNAHRLCLAWEVLRLQNMDQKYYRSRGIVRHLEDATRFVNPGVYRVLDDYPRRADGETPKLNEVVVEDDNQDVFYGTLMSRDEAHRLVENQTRGEVDA
ncbi:MAG: hypothetical protein CL484_10005 [Acidobacteria bacterium]|nr:hypothetical protein [Acidobacteriota bacterium]